MTPRGKWQGMWSIARFNWPFYVVALVVLAASVIGLVWLPSLWARVLCGLAGAGALHFLVVSLSVTHLVYDRSDLYRWGWLARVLHHQTPTRAILCHAGYDECSPALKEKLATVKWTVLDHYDESRMAEPSIHRARRLFPPAPGTIPAPHHTWPAAAEPAGLILGILAIHEFRSEAERTAWFAEARRCLQPEGRIVVVEHLRNFPNFLAFGPGFLHFHARSSWQRCWQAAGLRVVDEFSVTPWVRVFVLSPA
jgi:hypothetical protein